MSKTSPKTSPKTASKKLIPAATVLLIRDGAQGLEVFMVERHHQIDFASSALVFPGGRVDEYDHQPELRDACIHWEEDDPKTLPWRAAAIREAFEETGILLARDKNKPEDLISGDHAFSLWDFRKKVEDRAPPFAEFLRQHDLQADCAALSFYAHWITPEMMPKRFDTHFFIAAAPAGQAGLHDGREMVDSIWLRPKDAIKDGEEGRRQVIFPTRMNLALIADCESVAQAMEETRQRKVVTVLPKMDTSGSEPVLRIPAEAGYPVSTEPIRREML